MWPFWKRNSKQEFGIDPNHIAIEGQGTEQDPWIITFSGPLGLDDLPQTILAAESNLLQSDFATKAELFLSKLRHGGFDTFDGRADFVQAVEDNLPAYDTVYANVEMTLAEYLAANPGGDTSLLIPVINNVDNPHKDLLTFSGVDRSANSHAGWK